MIPIIPAATSYGEKIKMELLKQKKTQEWLITELQKKSGNYVDRSNLHKLMTGKIKASWMTDAIEEILGVKYESGE